MCEYSDHIIKQGGNKKIFIFSDCWPLKWGLEKNIIFTDNCIQKNQSFLICKPMSVLLICITFMANVQNCFYNSYLLKGPCIYTLKVGASFSTVNDRFLKNREMDMKITYNVNYIVFRCLIRFFLFILGWQDFRFLNKCETEYPSAKRQIILDRTNMMTSVLSFEFWCLHMENLKKDMIREISKTPETKTSDEILTA